MKLDRDKLIRAREMLGYGVEKTAEEASVSKNSVLRAEHEEDIRPGTARKIAAALGVRVADLLEESETLKVQAPPSQQLTLNGALEEERRTAWESAVENARRLREDGLERMRELLSTWRASKEGGETYDARRGYLDAMGTLLQQAYDAETALLESLSGTKVMAEQFPEKFREAKKADRFYIELLRLVQVAGLSISTKGEQDEERGESDDEQAEERVQSEKRPYSVEERLVA